MDTRANEWAEEAHIPAATPTEEQVWASRAAIERATGVLMERYGLDAEQAKETLLQASRHAAVSMVQFAGDVLTSGRAGEHPEIRVVLDAASAPSGLRKAVAFIESEAARPIRLADIVAAAGSEPELCSTTSCATSIRRPRDTFGRCGSSGLIGSCRPPTRSVRRSRRSRRGGVSRRPGGSRCSTGPSTEDPLA